MARPDLFAIIGMPVLHSRSPRMHKAAFHALGLDARYIRIAADSKEEGLATSREMGLKGLNVTAPFKDIVDIVDYVDPLAAEAGAVNTVLLDGGKARGYNSDVDGVARALIANGIGIKGMKAVVLGAGGASRAAVVALLRNGAEVTIANRTVEKARAVAEESGASYCPLSGPELEKALAECGLIVGCLGTAGRAIPKGALRKGIAVMDAYYASETALVRDGREAGCRIIDGREWLLYQGVRSFELFTGRKAPVEAMRKAGYSEYAGMKKQNIAIIGFMGSGKSTIAKAIHDRTAMPVLGLDAEIEKKAGKSIRKIFEDDGEAKFRKLESREVSALGSASGRVIDCGGGAVLDARNREMLGRNAVVVWLWAGTKTIAARIPRDGARPLLDVPDPEKEAGSLLQNRLGAYADACDMMVNTTGKSPEYISERILYEVNKAGSG